MINLHNHKHRAFFAYLTWALGGSLLIWLTPKPWNFDFGLPFIATVFFIPEWNLGSFSFVTVRKNTGELAWDFIQFIAWISVIVSGLATFFALRCKAGIIFPLNINLDSTLALIFSASSLVFLETKLCRFFLSQEAETEQVFDPGLSIGHLQFNLLTILLLGFETYAIDSNLRMTPVPALLTSYPVPPFSVGVIYLISAILKILLSIKRT